MRATIIFRWSPENILKVNKLGVSLAKGEAEKEILEASNRCKVIWAEVPYGQCMSIQVVEGDEKDIFTWTRPYYDIAKVEILPSLPSEEIAKLGVPWKAEK
jgi:hypothetical protein